MIQRGVSCGPSKAMWGGWQRKVAVLDDELLCGYHFFLLVVDPGSNVGWLTIEVGGLMWHLGGWILHVGLVVDPEHRYWAVDPRHLLFGMADCWLNVTN